MEIIIAALIPLLSGYASQRSSINYTIAILGFTIVFIAGILTLYRFQENRTSYRTTCETLKHEKFLFITNSKQYDEKDAFSLFVQRIEGHISKEYSTWITSIIKNYADKDN